MSEDPRLLSALLNLLSVKDELCLMCGFGILWQFSIDGSFFRIFFLIFQQKFDRNFWNCLNLPRSILRWWKEPANSAASLWNMQILPFVPFENLYFMVLSHRYFYIDFLKLKIEKIPMQDGTLRPRMFWSPLWFIK